MNQNIYGIIFSGNIDYLDLQIYKDNRKLHSRTYFKQIDRNIICPQNVATLPKGQFMRTYRNCRDQRDYENKSKVLMHRFFITKEKHELLRNEVKKMKWETFQTTKNKKNIY